MISFELTTLNEIKGTAEYIERPSVNTCIWNGACVVNPEWTLEPQQLYIQHCGAIS